MPIHLATTDQQIEKCFDVLSLLRPQLSRTDFVDRIRRLQSATGFQLAYLEEPDIKTVAGFRISEWLAGGRYLEIEDLVSSADARSQGYGGQLFDWLVEHARHAACDHVRLVSRTDRTAAHDFYKRKGMVAQAYYFTLPLGA